MSHRLEMVFPLLYTIAKIQCHFGGINRSVQFKVFFGNENTFPLSSAIYSRILDIEGLLTRNQTTLFISTGIPFFLFKLRSIGTFLYFQHLILPLYQNRDIDY